jgi:hypothetical protein
MGLGSGIRDPGVKKAPDTGSGSATLVKKQTNYSGSPINSEYSQIVEYVKIKTLRVEFPLKCTGTCFGFRPLFRTKLEDSPAY